MGIGQDRNTWREVHGEFENKETRRWMVGQKGREGVKTEGREVEMK